MAVGWTIFITALLDYCCVIHITINCHWRGPSKVQRVGVVTRRRSFNSVVVVIVVVTLMVLRSTTATTFVVASVVVSSTSVVAVLARGRLHGLVEHGVVVVGRGYGVVVVVVRRNRSMMAVATPVGIVAAIPSVDVVGVVGTTIVGRTLPIGWVTAAFSPRVASRLAITGVLMARRTIQGLRLR